MLVVLIPVRRPFPHIAGHFVEAIAVGRESTDWRRPLTRTRLPKGFAKGTRLAMYSPLACHQACIRRPRRTRLRRSILVDFQAVQTAHSARKLPVKMGQLCTGRVGPQVSGKPERARFLSVLLYNATTSAL
jgi:hypothetical protein